MKLIMCYALLIITLFSGAFAGWEEITHVTESSTIRKSKQSGKFTEIRSSESLEMNIKKGISLKFLVTAKDSILLTLYKNKSEVKSVMVKNGNGEMQYYFEPGVYTLRGTSTAEVRIVRWKKVKMDNVMPEGGGYPRIMIHKGKQYEYYSVSESSKPPFKVLGPATINIYSRSSLPEELYKTPVELTVKENNRIVLNRTDTLERSGVVTLQSDPNAILTRASVTQFKVPKGVHIYTINLNSTNGIVKVYKEQKSTSLSSPSALKKMYGTFKVITVKDYAYKNGS